MKTKFLSLSFLAASIITILLRIIEMLFFIDPSTGFYYSGFRAFSFVNIFLIIAFAVLYYLVVRLNKPKYKSAGELHFSNAFGALFCVTGFTSDLIIKLCSSSGISVSNVIFLIMAIVFFSAQIAYNLLGKEIMPILTLLPIPYWLYMLIKFFIEITDMAIISENLYRLTAISLMLVSFTLLAKVMCYVNLRKNARWLTVIGLTTVMVVGVGNVAEYILVIFQKSNALHYNELPDVTLFLSAIYLLIYILTLNKRTNLAKA